MFFGRTSPTSRCLMSSTRLLRGCGITGASEQTGTCFVRYVEWNGGDECFSWAWRSRSMVCEDTHRSNEGHSLIFLAKGFCSRQEFDLGRYGVALRL